VALLVFQSPEPVPIHAASPWIDCRFMAPLDVMLQTIEAQSHRRFVKSHLPFDALPVYESVRYIHVARDGRDACMSFFNHSASYTDFALARFDAIGMEDETIGRPFPRPPQDAREFYMNWIAPDAPAAQSAFFFATEQSYWDERGRDNLLLVHFGDLKADLDGEMRRASKP
jgi:aryl sulfotransferase